MDDGVFASSLTETNIVSDDLLSSEIPEQVALSFSPFGSSDGGGIILRKDSALLMLVCDILTGRASVQKTERVSE